MKCENVLVFNGQSSAAESWIAKLSDFGHSTLGLESREEHQQLHEANIGTQFYSPPELDDGPIAVSAEKLKRIDVWCWGMLLWRVMIEGTEYLDSLDLRIEHESHMKELRQQPTFSIMASQSCQHYLESHHAHERPLVFRVCEILRRTLDHYPMSRPSSRDLLREIEELTRERYEIRHPAFNTFGFAKPLPHFSPDEAVIPQLYMSSFAPADTNGSGIFQSFGHMASNL